MSGHRKRESRTDGFVLMGRKHLGVQETANSKRREMRNSYVSLEKLTKYFREKYGVPD